mmetsp:Transcript_51517/g.70180  ORF Transcript_51517/g.70180 Transcript_51517/m.70180 type:complete len:85 (-) Transcript_51517:1264-1518(-)
MQSLSAQGASRSLPALQYANESFEDDFDWLLHVDDDTYVVLSELVPFLKQIDHQEPWYLGVPRPESYRKSCRATLNRTTPSCCM